MVSETFKFAMYVIFYDDPIQTNNVQITFNKASYYDIIVVYILVLSKYFF